jgi:hypothetical protein
MNYMNPLGGGGDPILLPGHVISPGDLGQKFDFSDVLAARYVRRAYLAAEQLPPEQGGRLTARADAVVQAGAFRVGSRFFEDGVSDPDMVPAMLWCNLRVSEPGITFLECARLVTDANRRAIKLAIWRAWGYRVENPKPDAPAGTPTGAAASFPTGTPSSGSSVADAT